MRFPLNHLNPCFELRELGQQSWRCIMFHEYIIMFHEYIDPECIQKIWYLTHLETILCYNNFDHFQWIYTIVNVGDSYDTQSTANVQPPKSVTLTAIPAACHIRSAWSGCQNSKRNLGCEKRSVWHDFHLCASVRHRNGSILYRTGQSFFMGRKTHSACFFQLERIWYHDCSTIVSAVVAFRNDADVWWFML